MTGELTKHEHNRNELVRLAKSLARGKLSFHAWMPQEHDDDKTVFQKRTWRKQCSDLGSVAVERVIGNFGDISKFPLDTFVLKIDDLQKSTRLSFETHLTTSKEPQIGKSNDENKFTSGICNDCVGITVIRGGPIARCNFLHETLKRQWPNDLAPHAENGCIRCIRKSALSFQIEFRYYKLNNLRNKKIKRAAIVHWLFSENLFLCISFLSNDPMTIAYCSSDRQVQEHLSRQWLCGQLQYLNK